MLRQAQQNTWQLESQDIFILGLKGNSVKRLPEGQQGDHFNEDRLNIMPSFLLAR